MLRLVGKLTPPRVQAAVFSTRWNRWTTSRRFQKEQCCLLCARHDSEDSIEHYSCCSVVRNVLTRYLRLDHARFACLHSFLLIHADINSKECLVKIALLIYAVYSVTNALRGRPSAGVDYFEAIKQAIRDG